MAKERSEGCRCRLNVLVDVGVRGEAGGDYGAQVLELGAEVDEAAVVVDEDLGGFKHWGWEP